MRADEQRSARFARSPDAVLMFMDHSFEMLLKAGILHRGGPIREPGEKNMISFDYCVRRALSDGQVKFLTNEQALTLHAINGVGQDAEHVAGAVYFFGALVDVVLVE